MRDIVKGSTRSEPTRVPALSKAIAILRFLNASPRLSAGVSEIAVALGIAKSHCFNILRTLESEGWVRFDAERRRYDLSARLLTDVSRLLAGSMGVLGPRRGARRTALGARARASWTRPQCWRHWRSTTTSSAR